MNQDIRISNKQCRYILDLQARLPEEVVAKYEELVKLDRFQASDMISDLLIKTAIFNNVMMEPAPELDKMRE